MSVKEKIEQTALAAYKLLDISDSKVRDILISVANLLEASQKDILLANKKDLAKMPEDDPKYDRLKLTPDRLKGIADDLKLVAQLPEPQGKVLDEFVRPNGIHIRKVSVPFGVVGIIYEARPNVTCDVFALCFKSKNACLLKGGSDAEESNKSLVALIHKVLIENDVDPAICTLLPGDRQATTTMLQAVGKVDLIIPRGSSSLINYVRENARVPVIETGAGVCHTYFDANGDKVKARDIVFNAKTRRVSVCNSMDCLIIHRDRLDDLPFVCAPLADKNVIICADEPALRVLAEHYPTALLQSVDIHSYGTEFLDYKMSVKTVNSLDEALTHIACYGSKHSECIVSDSEVAIRRFEQQVDASCVYANVSTAFTDGAQFGFGAEIGISTQKMHARGPMALPELTTYKYIIEGSGQIRN